MPTILPLFTGYTAAANTYVRTTVQRSSTWPLHSVSVGTGDTGIGTWGPTVALPQFGADKPATEAVWQVKKRRTQVPLVWQKIEI